MFKKKMTERNHEIISTYLNPGDLAIDCTMGNGYDTLFLKNIVGESGQVISFDIQDEAIINTERLIGKDSKNVELHLNSNVNIDKYVREEASVIVYNLGYLPNSSHDITTEAEDIIKSISKSMELIKVGGLISIMTYSGHDDGKEESVILEFLAKVDKSRFEVITIYETNKINATKLNYIFKLG